MARSYAQLHQRIWADPDWRALDLGAQHLYFLLISQPQTNLAGVIPLQLRKWASCVDGWDIGDVATALDRLRDDRFVIVDEDTEEVLVRTLIRNDTGYKTPGMLKSILRFAEQAQSPAIRATLHTELGKLEPLVGKKAEEGTSLIAATRAALRSPNSPSGPGGEPIPDGIGDGMPDGIGDTIQNGSRNPSAIPSPNPSRIPSVTGTGTGTSLALVKEVVGGNAPRPPDEPPKCKRHDGWDREDIPDCGACGRLRRRWQDERDELDSLIRAEAAKPKPLCPEHPGQVATHCGPCRSERIGRDTA